MKFLDLLLGPDEETEGAKEDFGYSDMLGLNKRFEFMIPTDKAATVAEFDTAKLAAEALLAEDIERFGMTFEKIPAALKNKIMGIVGSMTMVADKDGNISIFFHRRNDKGYWDYTKSKKYPEKDTTGKFKHEIFFALDDEE